jgi:hypothetical protein
MIQMVVIIGAMESFEKPQTPEDEKAGDQSRRDFIKKGLAFLAVAAIAPDRDFRSSR